MVEKGATSLENVVDYKIFVLSTNNGHGVSADLEELLFDILSYAQTLTDDYIWEKDCFSLTLQHLKTPSPNDSLYLDQNIYFEGSTNFGDNIDDEWFIVYLLFNITKQFPFVVSSVTDNDGEFLLIEVADYLPKWLEPETSENRIFIYQGNLHIIPFPSNPSEITIIPTGKPTLQKALAVLKTNDEKTIAFPWIQDVLHKKIIEQKQKSKECFHHVLCFIPKEVKYLLETNCSLISLAVSAFVNQDIFDIKSSHTMKFDFQSLVPYRVRFTKSLFAQLVQHEFTAGSNVSNFLPGASSPWYKGHLIGLKLTYGFLILCNQQHGLHTGVCNSSNQTSEKWKKYLDSLKKHGYFRNEIVGSQLYNQLLKNAKEYFFRITDFNSSQFDPNVSKVKHLLETMPSSYKEQNLLKPEEFPCDDDESWLDISPEQIDSILFQYGKNEQINENIDLQEVVFGMNSFVEKMSSFEGAELPNNILDNDIEFDPEGFVDCINDYFLESKPNDDDSSDNEIIINEEIEKYASAMDKELSKTNIGKSFVMVKDDIKLDLNKDEPSQLPNMDNVTKQVDIDLNLVQNFLESYSLQQGLSGPVSNILGSMGLSLPENAPQKD
ncbi:protein ecdysoneless homolog [Xenia sp. Carnegie-2017]|uniref:protein ecdysoneless homolog n=1 Tax=Xenia sp. Carnegie-2017 TaxID=2897299 RepID=UPI001F03B6E5|nr:protein ecdysoneless homolog [Xenia sp. Carnegie-2017]